MMRKAKQIEPYTKPTLPPSAAYGGFSRYGNVKDVTKVVRIEMQQASKLVFSFTRADADSPRTTYEL